MDEDAACFVVDIDALGGLRDALFRLRSELGQLDYGNTTLSAAQTGDPPVAAAVDRFVANWRDGRTRLENELDGCLSVVAAAIDTYTRAETAVQAATQPSVGEPG